MNDLKPEGIAGGRFAPWTEVEAFIETQTPATWKIPGSPECRFTLSSGGLLSLRMETDELVIPDNLPHREMKLKPIETDDRFYLELTTLSSGLSKELFTFACGVADRVQLEGQDPVKAVHETQEAWESLLARRTRLTPEKELGLIGELWFLSHLAEKIGSGKAVAAWKGPKAEEHDFGLSAIDLEVKTTRSESRHHMIGSLTQMLPNSGRDLYLLSIQLTDAAGAKNNKMSLASLIVEIRKMLSSENNDVSERFEELLAKAGWSENEADMYKSEYILRSKPALIKVDDDFPSITPTAIEGLSNSERILEVRYRVDLEGMGEDFDDHENALLLEDA